MAVKKTSGDKESKTTAVTKGKPTAGKKKRQKNVTPVANVIYIGHLPDGCEERELIGFLKQFGILSQLRLCRSQKTGGSKGYAFAKFQDVEVAAIVADTLNGHLLFNKKLISHVLAPEQIHTKLFASKTRTIFQRKSYLVNQRQQQPKSMEKMEVITKRLIEREQTKRDKLKAMGIDYDFPGYEGSKNKKQKQQQDDDEEDGELSDTQNDATAENESDNEEEEKKKVKKKKEKKKKKKKSKETDSPASDTESPPQKRKHSIDDEDQESPETTKDETKRSHSEKKAKKKKKKDKKRRQSAP